MISDNVWQTEITAVDRREIAALQCDAVCLLNASRQRERMNNALPESVSLAKQMNEEFLSLMNLFEEKTESMSNQIQQTTPFLEEVSAHKGRMRSKVDDMNNMLTRLEAEVNRQRQSIAGVVGCLTRVSEAVTKMECDVSGQKQATTAIEMNISELSTMSRKIEDEMAKQGLNMPGVPNNISEMLAESKKIEGELMTRGQSIATVRDCVSRVLEVPTRINGALTTPVYLANPWVVRCRLNELVSTYASSMGN
jgi:septal ring factor EnvC (AmiA/AmiB activator)